MTNTKLLRDIIAKSGLKISFIATAIGISRAALYRKINNITPFNQFEIEKLCELLSIKSLKDKNAIFFCERCRQISLHAIKEGAHMSTIEKLRLMAEINMRNAERDRAYAERQQAAGKPDREG